VIRTISIPLYGWLLALGWTLGGVGCGTSSEPVGSQELDTYAARALAVFYGEFSGEHGGRAPKDEAEFREFLATRSDRLAEGGLDIERILTSPRSNQPWVVAYGSAGPLELDGRWLVAYEPAAVDGQRLTVNVRGGLEKIEDAKFRSVAVDGR
jgi:hypothetical protein